MTRFLLWLLAALSAFVAQPALADELVVDAASNFLIDATINGHPVRLRVDPETSGYIILNPATIERIGLRPSLLRSRTRIGPIQLEGWSKVAELAIDGVTGDRRMVWIDRPVVDGADGLISPADLRHERIVFNLSAPLSAEAPFELPLEFDRSGGLFFSLQAGADLIRVQFSLIKPDSLATAAAGARLAELNGGQWTGEPREQVIDFGVMRPVRPLELADPAALDGFRFATFLVRTSDNRGNLDLPPDPNADPDEVVVTGSRQRARFEVTLGLDRLRHCSRLVWNNRTRRMHLTCRNIRVGTA